MSHLIKIYAVCKFRCFHELKVLGEAGGISVEVLTRLHNFRY